MKFSKFQALGNDFLLMRSNQGRDIACRMRLSPVPHATATRHRSDGLVLYQHHGGPESDFAALDLQLRRQPRRMSGNGIRCLAAHLHESGRSGGESIRLRTVAGIRVLKLQNREGESFLYEAQMGVPITEPLRYLSALRGRSGILCWTIRWTSPRDDR